MSNTPTQNNKAPSMFGSISNTPSIFGNNSTLNNNAPSIFPNLNNQQTSGSLFKNISQTKNQSIFSNKQKTIIENKKQEKVNQAHKLLFPNFDSSKSTSGMFFNNNANNSQNVQKKSEISNQRQTLTTNNLFGNSIKPGSLFGNFKSDTGNQNKNLFINPNNTQKGDIFGNKKQTPRLFESKTQDKKQNILNNPLVSQNKDFFTSTSPFSKKQDKPLFQNFKNQQNKTSTGLFNTNKINTSASLSLFSNNISKNQQPKQSEGVSKNIPSLFGSKPEQRKKQQPKIFGGFQQSTVSNKQSIFGVSNENMQGGIGNQGIFGVQNKITFDDKSKNNQENKQKYSLSGKVSEINQVKQKESLFNFKDNTNNIKKIPEKQQHQPLLKFQRNNQQPSSLPQKTNDLNKSLFSNTNVPATSKQSLFTNVQQQTSKTQSKPILNYQNQQSVFNNSNQQVNTSKESANFGKGVNFSLFSNKNESQDPFANTSSKDPFVNPSAKDPLTNISTKSPLLNISTNITNKQTQQNIRKDKKNEGPSMLISFSSNSNIGATQTIQNNPSQNTNFQSDRKKLSEKSSNIIGQTKFRSSTSKQVQFLKGKQKQRQKQQYIFTGLEVHKLLEEFYKVKSLNATGNINNQGINQDLRKQIEPWIIASFNRQQNNQDNKKIDVRLHQNGDVNKFLNDIAATLLQYLNIKKTEHSIMLINKTFLELLKQDKLTQCLIINGQLNNPYFLRHQIYTFGQTAQLNLQSQELNIYLFATIKYFTLSQLNYIHYISSCFQALRPPSKLFNCLLTYCLQYSKHRIVKDTTKNKITALIKEYQLKAIKQITNILQKFLKVSKNIELVNKESINTILLMLENIHYQQKSVIELALKVILGTFDLKYERGQYKFSSQTIRIVKQSKSLALLPFRIILPKITNSQKINQVLPSPQDLFCYVNGLQWIDWLQIYLDSSEAERQVGTHQSQCILNILKTEEQPYSKLDPTQKIQKSNYQRQNLLAKVLHKKKPIYKFIFGLKEENQMDLFYQFLTKLIFDYESFRKIQECYFRQKGQLNYQMKSIIAQIANYPTLDIKQQIPFFTSKLIYFLKIIQIAPDKLHTLQKELFYSSISKKEQKLSDFKLQTQNTHKLCHFVIDTINYFQRKCNQQVIGKAIRCINSLLSNNQTHLTMKIAMVINKPKMKFLQQNRKISPSLADSMNQLLYIIVQNQSFVDCLGLNFDYKSQSFLELYPFRYSYRQYIPLLNKILKDEQNQYTINFSSYWIYQCLLALTRQTPTATILNVLLEKLIIFPTSLKEQSQINSMQEQVPLASYYKQSISKKVPKILLYIVNALNDIGIIDFIMKDLVYEIRQSSQIQGTDKKIQRTILGLVNKKLEESSKGQELELFLILKLLKTLLTIYRLYQNYRDKTDHFIIKILSKLKCLNQLQQFYLNPCQRLDSQMDKQQNVNVLIGLMSLLQQKEQFFNTTIIDQKQFLAYDKSNYQKIHKLYKEHSAVVNYQVLNNFLHFSNNKYLQSYESLNTLIFDCLSLLVNKQKGSTFIKIQKFTFGGNFYQSSQEIAKANYWVIEQFCNKTVNILAKSRHIHTKESIYKFLICCKKSSQNSNIGSKIFLNYVKRMGPAQKSIRINSLMARIISYQLQEQKNYCKISESLLDNLLKNIINSLNVKDPIKIINIYQSRNASQNLPYHQFERFHEERNLIDIGLSYQAMTCLINILKKKFYENKTKLQAFRSFNTVVAKYNLVLMSSIYNKNASKPKNQLQNEYPRLFNSDPLSKFIQEGRKPNHKFNYYVQQSKNVIQWLNYQGIRLNKILNDFIQFQLTIDRTFYGNNAIQTINKINKQLFCHQHLGTVKYSAIQLFGDSYGEAIINIKSIHQTCFTKLQNGLQENHSSCFEIMSFCLQWLSAQILDNQTNILASIIQKSSRNLFWLNLGTLEHSQVIHYLTCLISIGKKMIDEKVLTRIKLIIQSAIIKASSSNGLYKGDQICLQKLLTLCIETSSKSIQLSTIQVIQRLVYTWTRQANSIFFYNQSRIIIEFAFQYPNQIAKFKPLTTCQKLKKSSTSYEAYVNKLRTPLNISWIWGLKVAASLMSCQEQSVPINQEVGLFIFQNKLRILNVLTLNPQKIQLAYLEQLESTMQLLLAFGCSKTLLTVHRILFEEIVYILAHKSITFFLQYIGGKKKFIVCSQMETKLSQVFYKDSSLQSKNDQSYLYQFGFRQVNGQSQSMFYLAMETKMLYCLRTFAMLLSKCFQQSYFIQKYFDSAIWQNYKYALPFWDRLNKSIVDILRFSSMLMKRWNKIEKLEQKIQMMNDCFKCPQFFVQSGYISAVFQYPKNKQNLYEQICLLGLMSFQLASVHLIQQKKFRTKYNTLMKSHIDGFSKKIIMQSKLFMEQIQEKMQFEFVNMEDFSKIAWHIQNIAKAN